MPRVVGIDPGTVSIDVCGLADGELYLDRTWPAAEAVRDPEAFARALVAAGRPDLVLGPSGYGLPLRPAAEVSDEELRLAFLAAPGEEGGIGGLRRLARALGATGLPVMYSPGVIHLDTVPEHRKLNRVDLGTADKLCAAALGIYEQRERRERALEEVAFILLELGGAFTAAVAVEGGQVVDGIGGTSGPIGWRAAGALDGEVAFLAGEVTKSALFRGGVETVAGLARAEDAGKVRGVGSEGVSSEAMGGEKVSGEEARTTRDLERGSWAARWRMALEAYIEGAVKAVRQLQGSAPAADEVLLSGRMAADPLIQGRLRTALRHVGEVRLLDGFARVAKQGAQGAALIADGLAGGRQRPLVERLRVREARGTVLDHLHVVSPAAARRRLGLGDA